MKRRDHDVRTPERPVRVLMVIRLFYPWLGGTQRQAHRLARELLDRGVDVRIVTGWWFRGTPQRETIDGIPVFRNHTLWEGFGVRGARTLAGYLYILTLLWYLWRRRDAYDVIHVHGLSYHAFAAALAGRWLGKPTIAKLANSGRASDIGKMCEGQHLAFSRLMLPTALRCDRFVALNAAVERELLEAGVPGDAIVRIPNGIELPAAPAEPVRGSGRAPRVVFVGRLHPQKGVDVLLRAAALLRERRPGMDVRYDLVGDGPQRDELVALGGELGVGSLVRFLGNRDDVEAHLAKADVFVLPSRAEGMSNALLEAMSCGLPVVAAAVPGNTDVLEQGTTGILVEPEDPDRLAEALSEVLDDPDLRERLGRAARHAVQDRYTIRAVGERYLALYRELLTVGSDTTKPRSTSRSKIARAPSAGASREVSIRRSGSADAS
jgi:glycosyltransferase involved in cell wall biosynthesis